MNRQLAGLEDVTGTYIFDVRQSVKALRLNRFFWNMRDLHFRDRVIKAPASVYDELDLNTEERHLVDDRNWLGLVQYGVSFFVLEKFARLVKVSNLEVYASMRGETLKEFLATRRVPESA